MRLELARIARQRRDQRTRIAAFLEQHDLPVRQNTAHVFVAPNNLAADAVERNDSLSDPAVLVAMRDTHRLRLAVVQVNERADVVELLDRGIHPVEPQAGSLPRTGRTGEPERDDAGRYA